MHKYLLSLLLFVGTTIQSLDHRSPHENFDEEKEPNEYEEALETYNRFVQTRAARNESVLHLIDLLRQEGLNELAEKTEETYERMLKLNEWFDNEQMKILAALRQNHGQAWEAKDNAPIR